MKKYLIALILLNIVILGFTAFKSREFKQQQFTVASQQRNLRELKDQFARLSDNYVLATSMALANEGSAKPKIFLRLRVNGCELCNVQVLKKIASLPMEQQARFTLLSDNLSQEKLKQNYSFSPVGVAIEIMPEHTYDKEFREPKSYLFSANADGSLNSFFIPEYDLPELIEGYFAKILK